MDKLWPPWHKGCLSSGHLSVFPCSLWISLKLIHLSAPHALERSSQARFQVVSLLLPILSPPRPWPLPTSSLASRAVHGGWGDLSTSPCWPIFFLSWWDSPVKGIESLLFYPEYWMSSLITKRLRTLFTDLVAKELIILFIYVITCYIFYILYSAYSFFPELSNLG